MGDFLCVGVSTLRCLLEAANTYTGQFIDSCKDNKFFLLGSFGIGTELKVHVYNEIIINALILRQLLLLDGCVFSCKKSGIVSIRGPPC